MLTTPQSSTMFHSKASGMLLKGRMGLTSSMAWAVAKQLAAVSLSVSNV